MTTAFVYHEPPDIPAGMTLDEYRRARATARSPRRRRRRLLRRRLRTAPRRR